MKNAAFFDKKRSPSGFNNYIFQRNPEFSFDMSVFFTKSSG